MWAYCLILFAAPLLAEPFTSPAAAKPEYGHGLSAKEAQVGWIALFDGQSTYGWTDAAAESGVLSGGKSTSDFGSAQLQGEAVAEGEITMGDQTFEVGVGKFEQEVSVTKPGKIVLGQGLRLKTLLLKPAGLKPVWNGRDLTGWTVLRHPKLPDDRQTRWTISDGVLRGVNGPGAVELDGRYGDLVIQIEVRMRAKLVNGGLFFRSVPGQFMNGYEAQLFNGCYKEDPGQPARYSTGAIDDRLLARRLVSRDLEPFVMTVIAVGPHISTWVNGYQTVDFTDTRTPHANPREGLRVEPGTIQLQAHDPETDIEFRRVEVAEIK